MDTKGTKLFPRDSKFSYLQISTVAWGLRGSKNFSRATFNRSFDRYMFELICPWNIFGEKVQCESVFICDGVYTIKLTILCCKNWVQFPSSCQFKWSEICNGLKFFMNNHLNSNTVPLQMSMNVIVQNSNAAFRPQFILHSWIKLTLKKLY